MSERILARFAEAYRQMATVAKYRPAAPGDGVGGTYLSQSDLDDPAVLEAESLRFAEELLKQDNDSLFKVYGCTDWMMNRAIVYLLSAATLCCTGSDSAPLIERLIVLALEETRAVQRDIG